MCSEVVKVVGILVTSLLQIFTTESSGEKKLVNQYRFDRIMAMSSWPHFFGPTRIRCFKKAFRCFSCSSCKISVILVSFCILVSRRPTVRRLPLLPLQGKRINLIIDVFSCRGLSL